MFYQTAVLKKRNISTRKLRNSHMSWEENILPLTARVLIIYYRILNIMLSTLSRAPGSSQGDGGSAGLGR